MNEPSVPILAGQMIWGLLAVASCAALGVHRPRKIAGPVRLSPGEPNVRLAGILFLVIAAWIAVPVMYSLAFAGRSGDTATKLTPSAMVWVGLGGYVAATLAVVLGNRLRHRPLGDFGLRPGQFFKALILAPAAALVILPLVFWSAVASEWVYSAVGYKHPMEHEMLRMLLDAPWGLKIVIVGVAVLAAPIVEELIFRGLLQTLLVRGLGRFSPSPRSPWAVWTGVVLASLLFASVHEAWSAPPIFFLALCLGYLYERTGNLYATMGVHLIFNAASTTVFLLSR